MFYIILFVNLFLFGKALKLNVKLGFTSTVHFKAQRMLLCPFIILLFYTFSKHFSNSQVLGEGGGKRPQPPEKREK